MAVANFRFPKVTLAGVQTAPVFLDRDATIAKIEAKTEEASALGADLVAFSEAFLPGFPTWSLVLAPTDQHSLSEDLYHQAVEVPGPAVEALSAIAAENNVVLSVGVTERSRHSVGTMWNSNLLFDLDGTLINHRRKLVPTWAEKLVWSYGDAFALEPVNTAMGRIGVLICGENTNPLARFALIEGGEQIHVAPYPPAWPTKPAQDTRNYDLGHAVTLRSAAHSFEGKLTTLAVSGLIGEDELDAIGQVNESAAESIRLAPAPLSGIIGPEGKTLSEPITGVDGIAIATVDLGESVPLKKIHDVSGGYQRFDVFDLSIRRDRRSRG